MTKYAGLSTILSDKIRHLLHQVKDIVLFGVLYFFSLIVENKLKKLIPLLLGMGRNPFPTS
nr:MAG TPA: hypothetical protein [Caudoviricetes sp.]